MNKIEEPILLFEPGTEVSHSAKGYVRLRIDVNGTITIRFGREFANRRKLNTCEII